MDLTRVEWRKSSYSSSQGDACVEVGVWRKSSYSGANGGDCVEVGLWHKSSYSSSNGGDCVEVSAARTGVEPSLLCLVRDSKDPAGPALAFTPDAWRTFTTHLKAAAALLA